VEKDELLSYPMSRECPFDPPPQYGELRRDAPFKRVRLWDGNQPWLLTRHEDVKKALTQSNLSAEPLREGYPHIFEARMAADKADRSFIRLDPPEHGRLRRMVIKEFTVRNVEKEKPHIQEIVDRLIDKMLAGPQPLEFVKEFAEPLPTEVIAYLLGVPYEDREIFHRATRVQFGSTSTPEEVGASLKELLAYLDDLISKKETDPQDDILSRLVTEQLVPGHLDRPAMVDITRLLLSAGHQTSINMTALSVLTLLQHPEELAKIESNPKLIHGAVQELLRYSSVIQAGVRRVAREDAEVNGHLVKKGEGVICALPSANRDEEVFVDPDRFDVTRDASAHLAFGYGIHQCLGQMLARVELEITIATLFSRIPGLRLAVPFDELRFREDMFVYGVYELPLTWNKRDLESMNEE
jgi:cytochrome P450